MAQPVPPDSLRRSNQHAQALLDVLARFSPEGAGQVGVPGLDEQVVDLQPDFRARRRAALERARGTLGAALAGEPDPFVRQDLEILLEAADRQIEGDRLEEKWLLPWHDVAAIAFQGLSGLLDDQVAPGRRTAALVRLRRYAGAEPGYEPLTALAMARTREKLGEPGLLGPVRAEVEKTLANAPSYAAGIGELFRKHEVPGFESDLDRLKGQLEPYAGFLRAEVLPRSRTDFRLPEELYAFRLQAMGVDLPLPELERRARVAFRETQNEMEVLAPLVAAENGWSIADYREVLRRLGERQLHGDTIVEHYRSRIRDLERIVRERRIVSLPERPVRMRLASEAESAAIPAPHMRPPRLIGNTGEMGEFVLPLRIPGSQRGAKLAMGDFTHEAASWTLAAHEARPGHELQFAALVEKGVSTARAIFAMNPVNVEGWALYMEAEMKPYEPLAGQLVALQHRLMRAARAILDPGLQRGEISRDEAMRVLGEDVCLSEAMATQEIERYTFWAPGQATTYFAGYQRLMELRADVERMLGTRFDRLSYHDFLLAQGVVPPRLLRRAVLEEYVPGRR